MQPNRGAVFLAVLALALAPGARADLKVGDRFPDLTKCKLEGKVPDLATNKVVLIDFWASWCIPCVQSFPTMEELKKQYGERGFVVIAVNVDEKKSDMTKFLKDHPVTFAVVRDGEQKLVEQTGIPTMPSSFVLGADGKVKFAHSGYHGSATKKEYQQEIESLLKDHK